MTEKPNVTSTGIERNESDGEKSASELLEAQERAARAYEAHPPRADRIFAHFEKTLLSAGITHGRIVEIGGRENPIRSRLDPKRFEYVQFDLEKFDDYTVVADITYCPHIPDNYTDVIYSVDVFEHVKRPWRAAAEISRILRPGGLVYTSTLFSWRYHPCPIDFWRYTPDALEFLFEDLQRVDSGFDTLERRRNIIGRGKSKLAPDAFGGWRENWRVYHIGLKSPRTNEA